MKHVNYDDTGDYLCVVNNKRENGMTRLLVQGKFLIMIILLTQFKDHIASIWM